MAKTSRRIVRMGLLAAGILSAAVIILPLVQQGPSKPETWGTVAGALAVITAVVSAWSSQRVLELQEDSQEPSIAFSLDTRRRPQLVQFRVANVGGSLAKEVEITWDEPLLDVDGKAVRISELPDGPDIIPVLPVGQSTAVSVGVAYRFFEKYKSTTYSGSVRYRTAAGFSRNERFTVSAEVFRKSLVHEDEEALTHEKLQKIPQQLEKIASEVAKLREILSSTETESDEGEG